MEKERHIKILSIIALVLAIAGMSLGFAAFSTTLNISSSASVTPNSDNFNIIFCNSINIGDCNSYVNHFLDYKTVNGATNGGTIADVMGTDNDYIKTVYRYLHSLYTRWRKPELAQKYREKLIEINRNIPKIT